MLSNLGLKIEKCEWTLQSKQAWQPNNPYPFLSEDIKKFLFNDWHSFVCQYVIKAYSSDEKAKDLELYNIQKLGINEKNAPEKIKSYRRQVLEELGETLDQRIIKIKNILQEREKELENSLEQQNQLVKTITEQEKQIQTYKTKSENQQKEININKQEINRLQNEIESQKQEIEKIKL